MNDIRSKEINNNLFQFYKIMYSENSGQHGKLKEFLKNDKKDEEFFTQNISKINKTLKLQLNLFEYVIFNFFFKKIRHFFFRSIVNRF
jgi:hypothetical protein